MAAREKKSIFLPEADRQPSRDLVLEVLQAAPIRRNASPFPRGRHPHHDRPAVRLFLQRRVSRPGKILDLFRRIDAEIQMSENKILNLVVEGETVGLRRSVVVRHHGTAAMTRLIVGDFLKIRDGKIAEIHEYSDTAWLKRLTDGED